MLPHIIEHIGFSKFNKSYSAFFPAKYNPPKMHAIKLSIWSSYLSQLHSQATGNNAHNTTHMKAQSISTISTLSNELKVDANILTPNLIRRVLVHCTSFDRTEWDNTTGNPLEFPKTKEC